MVEISFNQLKLVRNQKNPEEFG